MTEQGVSYSTCTDNVCLQWQFIYVIGHTVWKLESRKLLRRFPAESKERGWMGRGRLPITVFDSSVLSQPSLVSSLLESVPWLPCALISISFTQWKQSEFQVSLPFPVCKLLRTTKSTPLLFLSLFLFLFLPFSFSEWARSRELKTGKPVPSNDGTDHLSLRSASCPSLFYL